MIDEPLEEFEPELVKEKWDFEPRMRFFSDRELAQMYREQQLDSDVVKPEPESLPDAILRCLGTYPDLI